MAISASDRRIVSLPPGAPSLSLPQFARWGAHPMAFFEDLHRKYGDAFTIRFPALPAPLVVFTQPDAIRAIFAGNTDDFHAGEANRSLAPFVGEQSILLLDRRPHARQRKLLLPPFHGERMVGYTRDMIRAADAAIDRFPVGVEFPIAQRMRDVTLEVILRTVFGLAEGPRFEQMSRLLGELLDVAAWPLLLLPVMQRDLGRYSPWGKFLRLTQQMDALLAAQVEERRLLINQPDQGSGQDVLSLLLLARDEEGQPMTYSELRDELVTLLVAGHETTATALAWAVRWLLERRNCLRELEREVASALDFDGALRIDRIDKLPYLDAVVRETLRLQPVIPMVARKLMRPMTIGGYDLPADVLVAPSIYLSHRRPNTWPNPTAFQPNRWTHSKPGLADYFPFGGGARRCIGAAFATLEMKCVLASLVRRVTLQLGPSATVHVERRSITFAPAKGMPVIVRERADHLSSRIMQQVARIAPEATISPEASCVNSA